MSHMLTEVFPLKCFMTYTKTWEYSMVLGMHMHMHVYNAQLFSSHAFEGLLQSYDQLVMDRNLISILIMAAKCRLLWEVYCINESACNEHCFRFNPLLSILNLYMYILTNISFVCVYIYIYICTCACMWVVFYF